MKILHLYPSDDALIAAHVTMLREHEEPFNDKPDIVHVHGCWRYNIVRQANEYAESIIKPGIRLSDLPERLFLMPVTANTLLID